MGSGPVQLSSGAIRIDGSSDRDRAVVDQGTSVISKVSR